MATEKEEKLYQDRLKKLEKIRQSGLDPFPAKGERTHTVGEALEDFAKLEKSKKRTILNGRIKALRAHGGLVFGNIEDESGVMQFMLREEDLGKEKFAGFENFDIGDIFEATGTLLETKRGEKSLLLSDFKILTKSLRALPDQYHGLKDVETRLRKRYLDLLANPETRDMFRKKSVFWQTVREFLVEKGFLEVQTPVLENIAGGADAEPFVTHHNALDRDFYLRISLELPLKRLLVGGYEKVFEIGRLFRNEGIDREHLQEYDDVEFYMAYGNHEQGMELVEELFKRLVKNVTGGTKTNFEGQEIEWGKKWPQVDYFTTFEKEAEIDLNTATLADLQKKAQELKIHFDKSDGKGRLIDAIYKRTVRPKLIQPSFLVGHPIEISPLSKIDPENPKKVLRFQVLAVGSELGNGWAELNDPQDQRERFEQQMKLREAGDKEAQMLDEDFVEALEYGMPPAVGFGMSERVFSVFMDKSIRETVIFPPMKEAHSTPSSNPSTKSKPNVESKKTSTEKMMNRDEALKLLHEHVKSPNLLKHMLATEVLMRGLARKFGEDEHKWGIAGLLHDIDYDITKDPKEHSLKGFEILINAGLPIEICEAVKIHNPAHGIPPATLLDKALLTGETMTGFLVACALVTPEKKIANVNVDSAVKKFKSKSFAAGADREIMKQAEPLLGMKVEELIEICLKEMQNIAGDLGL